MRRGELSPPPPAADAATGDGDGDRDCDRERLRRLDADGGMRLDALLSDSPGGMREALEGAAREAVGAAPTLSGGTNVTNAAWRAVVFGPNGRAMRPNAAAEIA